MTWQDRLKEGAYTSPGGKRHTFIYEDVSRTFDKKTSAHEFPNADGTYVQDNGRTGRKYPLTAIFTGANCDTAADAYEDALAEVGRGKLEHPIYGTIDVVPFGTVTRNDALKTAANQSTVDVIFWETIPLIYPIPQMDPTSQVLSAVQDFTDALGLDVANKLDIFDPQAIATFKDRIVSQVQNVQTYLSKISGVKALIESKVATVMGLVDNIVTATTEIADSVRESVAAAVTGVMELVALPGQVAADIKTKLSSYKDMLASSISNIFPTDSESAYLGGRTAAECIVASVAVNLVQSELGSQGEATEAASDLLGMLDTAVVWEEQATESLGIISTGESYQALQDAIALTAGYLIEISFTLRKERRIVLTRSRTIVDLAAELYGEIDEVLDFFINSNDFTGSEIIEIPRGREVLYYV